MRLGVGGRSLTSPDATIGASIAMMAELNEGMKPVSAKVFARAGDTVEAGR